MFAQVVIILAATGFLVLQKCQAAIDIETNFIDKSPTPRLGAVSDEMIDLINNIPGITWKAGRNFHPDTPLSFFKGLCGALPVKDEDKSPRMKPEKFDADELPEFFDARREWPHCSSLWEIRDQGGCGSCWAVSTASAMTDRYCIGHKGREKFYFSEQHLLSCCETCRARESSDACEGGQSDKAWAFWADDDGGVVSGGPYESYQGCLPYEYPPCNHSASDPSVGCSAAPTPPKCTPKCEEYSNRDFKKDRKFGTGYKNIRKDPKWMQKEIYENGPIVADYMVYTDFLNYKSGVYNLTEYGEMVSETLHAVKIIGWGVEDGTPYWLVANSWNYYWGDLGGFFKIRRGTDECGIETTNISAARAYID